MPKSLDKKHEVLSDEGGVDRSPIDKKAAIAAINRVIAKRYDTDLKAYYESMLAYELFKHPQWFNSVELISQKLIEMITIFESEVNDLVNTKPEIAQELFGSTRFGFLPKPKETGETNTQIMISALKKQTNLSQVMHIHCTFFSSIMPELTHHFLYDEQKEFEAKYAVLSKIIDDSHLFDEKLRGRLDLRTDSRKASNQGGIVKSLMLKHLPSQAFFKRDTASVRALDRFQPDLNSSHTRAVVDNNIPFVAGPSGHTCNFLRGALLLNVLNHEQLKEYTLACFAMLTTGGNHSFYEVMTIAKLFGICADPTDYVDNIPEHIRCHTDFIMFARQFPGDIFEYKRLSSNPAHHLFERKGTSDNLFHNKEYKETLQSIIVSDKDSCEKKKSSCSLNKVFHHIAEGVTKRLGK